MNLSDRDVLGIHKQEIDTPALLIDLDVMDTNIAQMARFFRAVKAELRPHAKTHKTPAIAHKQIQAGAIGVTCAKLGEAEAMVHAGIRDVLIANQIVGTQKIARLMELAKQADMMVAVDSVENVEALSDASQASGACMRVLVEVDTGMARCGTEPGMPTLNLARVASKAKGLKFAGLMGYEGHTVMITRKADREQATRKSVDILVEMKRLVEDDGIPVEIMSGGGTGTYDITGSYPEMTEIQAGSYVLMDSTYAQVEGIGDAFGYALSVLTTVVSRPRPDRIITDAGLKVLSREFGFPQPVNSTGLELVSLSEEHGKLSAEPGVSLKPGDKLEILPTHGCTTINLHDAFYGIRNDKLECVWPIEARGKSR